MSHHSRTPGDQRQEGPAAEIGFGYLLLAFSSAPILLTDELADGFQAGQRVTITAVLIAGHLVAQKVELSGTRTGS